MLLLRHRAHLHKIVGIIVTIFILLIGATNIYAMDFPEWKDGTIQDESKSLSVETIDELNAEFALLPHPVKVIVLDQIDGELSDYVKQAFTYFELPDDQLLVIFVLNPGLMTALAGEKLDELGATHEFLNEIMHTSFVPLAREGDYLGGIQALITQLFADLDIDIEQETVPTLGDIINEEKEPSKASALAFPVQEQMESKKGAPIWVYLLFSILGLIALFSILIYLRRKQLYKQLQSMERWKDSLIQQWSEVNLDIEFKTMQEEVLIRLANLETTHQDYQERIFPEITDDLLDVESLLSRFRIIAAKEVLHYIEQTLDEAAYLLEQLHNELNQIGEIKVQLPRTVDKANGAINRLKERIDNVANQYGITLSHLREKMQKREKELLRIQHVMDTESSFDQNTLDQAIAELQKIDQDLNQIDQMSQELEEQIPNRLKNLEIKYKGVDLEDSAELVHILKEAREKWNSLITLWDEGKVNQVTEVIEFINSRLSQGEAIIQQESEQSQEIHNIISQFENRMQAILEVFRQDQRLFEKLYRKYQIEDDPIVDQLSRIDELEKGLASNYKTIVQKTEKREYKDAYQLATSIPNEVERLAELVAQFHARIESLSSEEERYSVEIKSLRNRLRLVRQQLDRSLLPGKQDQILDLVDQGFKAILETEVLFDQLPLRLNKILQLLDQAREQVVTVEELTRKTIEDAQETEDIIRRLNIYRTSIPQVAQHLMMAENAYRDQKFDEAVSHARKAEEIVTRN